MKFISYFSNFKFFNNLFRKFYLNNKSYILFYTLYLLPQMRGYYALHTQRN